MAPLAAGRFDVAGLAHQLYRPQYPGTAGARDPAGNRAQRCTVRLRHFGVLNCLHAGQPRLGPDSGPRRTAAWNECGGGMLDGCIDGSRLRLGLLVVGSGACGAGVRRRRHLSRWPAHGGANPSARPARAWTGRGVQRRVAGRGDHAAGGDAHLSVVGMARGLLVHRHDRPGVACPSGPWFRAGRTCAGCRRPSKPPAPARA